jgi:uncharacterized membrane protein
LKPYNYAFADIWIGGALGIFPGFIIGSIWHLSDKLRRNNMSDLPLVGLVGLISLLITFVCVFVVVPSFSSVAKYTEGINYLHKEDIVRIDVFNKGGIKLLKTIENIEIIKEFINSCRDVEGCYAPNHPRYVNSWYIIIYKKDKNIEMDCNILQNDDSKIYGDFVQRKNNSLVIYGSFKSVGLRKWLEKSEWRTVKTDGKSGVKTPTFDY